MNKILRIVLPGVLFLTLPAQAVELTPEAALDRALSSSTGVRRVPSRQARNYKLTYSEGKQVYVFSDEKAGGYLAVSGDDMAPAVLGYADAGHEMVARKLCPTDRGSKDSRCASVVP